MPQELEKMGAVVDVVEAYRTVKPDSEKDRLVEMFEKGEAIHISDRLFKVPRVRILHSLEFRISLLAHP